MGELAKMQILGLYQQILVGMATLEFAFFGKNSSDSKFKKYFLGFQTEAIHLTD